MKYSILSLFLLGFCLFSCNDDEMSGPGTGPIVPIDPNLINAFTWEAFVDEESAIDGESFFIRYPTIHEDLVVYSNDLRNGFAAQDRSTGEEVWNNYGQMSLALLAEEPSVVFGTMHLVNANTFKSINLESGAVLNDVPIGEVNEEVSERIGIFEDNVYANVEVEDGLNVTSEWLVSSLDNVSSDSFTRFNQSSNGDIGKPVFQRNANNEVLMIYAANFPTASMIAYNLTTDEIEWEINTFSTVGNISGIEQDGDQIYFAIGLNLIALDSNTGEEIYSRQHFINDLLNEDALVQDATRIYAVGSEVYIIDKATGDLVWTQQGLQIDNETFIPVRNSFRPILFQNNLYFTEISDDGLMIWVDTEDLVMDYFFIPDVANLEIDGIPVRLDGLNFTESGLSVSNDGIIYTYDRIRFLAFEAPIM